MRRLLQTICLLLAVTMLCSCASPKASVEPDILPDVLANISENLTVLDHIRLEHEKGLDFCESYIRDEITYGELNDRLRSQTAAIEACHPVLASEELKLQTLSEIKLGESLAFGEIVQSVGEDCVRALTFFGEYLYSGKSLNSVDYLLEFLSIYREEIACWTDNSWYTTNDYLMDYGTDSRIQEFCQQLQELPSYASLAQSWTQDPQKLSAQQELRWDTLQTNMRKLNLIAGNSKLELDDAAAVEQQTDEQYIQWLMEEFDVSEKIATEYLELRKVRTELEALKQKLRDKFAPSTDNNDAELISKAAHFAAANMYEEALNCLEVLSEKKDRTTSDFCIDAVRAVYTAAPQIDSCYGLLVIGCDDSSAIDVGLQEGDIIIGVNDTPIYNGAAYQDCKEERQQGYDMELLRMNEASELDHVLLTIPASTSFGFNGCDINTKRQE